MLVNNAGVAVEAPVPSLTVGQIRSVCEVDLFGVMTRLSSLPQRG